jgi:hypothetical protein
MTVNIWIVITKAARDILRDLMDDVEYDGQHIQAVKIFRKMTDMRVTERFWLKPTIGGKQRFLFSVNLPGSSKAKDAVDYLLLTYPSQISVAGAWWWDGTQVMGNGSPMYPINANQLKKFMPSGSLEQINVIQGQADRVFV